MLSDEEKQAIEGLKGSQKWIRQQIRLGNLPNYNQGHYADIQIVLNLIEKQSKEIEELKIAFNNCFDECTSLRENFHKQIEISKNKDKKWEDKIKAKIEPKLKELDEQINQEWKKYGNSKELQDMEDMYNFLQSLLEKE